MRQISNFTRYNQVLLTPPTSLIQKDNQNNQDDQADQADQADQDDQDVQDDEDARYKIQDTRVQ